MLPTLYRFVSLPRSETTVEIPQRFGWVRWLCCPWSLLSWQHPSSRAQHSSSPGLQRHATVPKPTGDSGLSPSGCVVLFPSPLFFLFCKGDLLDPGRTLQLHKFALWNMVAPIHVFPYSSNWYTQLRSSCIWPAGRAWTVSWFHLFYFILFFN